MYAKNLTCRKCGKVYPLDNRYSCEACGGILEVTYDYEEAFKQKPVEDVDMDFFGMWKYRKLLPVKDKKNIVTLGEGDTPLIDADKPQSLWGCRLKTLIKAEMLTPTGSFKDRPSSVGVSIAKEKGFKKIVVASSGNASASAAAYAARAGMDCVVFVPDSTDMNKVIQAQSYGAQVICVKGNYSRSFEMAEYCAKNYGWANITSTFINPYTVEGDKTPAYELYHQLRGQVPDYILIPIGSGPLLVGMTKGYEELKQMGLVDKIPAMIGVQAAACAPITKAFLERKEKVTGWEEPIFTAAGGISDPLLGYEKDGDLTLATVRRTGGMMVSLDEEEIAEALSIVEKKIGLYCEPTGAVSVGAIKKLWNEGYLKEGTLAVSMTTGHGFKFSKRQPKTPPVIENAEQIEQLVR